MWSRKGFVQSGLLTRTSHAICSVSSDLSGCGSSVSDAISNLIEGVCNSWRKTPAGMTSRLYRILVEDVRELKYVELGFKLAHFLAVGFHDGVSARPILHDLPDHQFSISTSKERADPE
jgi:hypothetical protein